MNRSKVMIGFVLAVCGLGIQAAFAQMPPGGAIYRLNPDSTFQTGCWPPCLCPLSPQYPTRGTFRLTPTDFDGLYQHYAVADVNWTIADDDPELRATGSGTYLVGGEFAVMQRLELDLYVGDQPLQHYDSGLVAGGGGFPNIQITISMNNMVCHDNVFVVDTSLVPPDEIHPYHLTATSTYQHGCRGACDCPPGPLRPISGPFALVPILTNPLFTEYAVIDVNWTVPPGFGQPAVNLQGVGTYRLGGEVAVQQRMRLDLTSDPGVAPQHFDSGTVPGGGNFPLIDISIVFQESICIQTVIDVHAEPSVLIASANPPAQNPYLPGAHPFRDVLQTGPAGSSTVQQGIGACPTPAEGPVNYCPITVSFSGPITLTPADVTVTCSYTGNPPGATPCPSVSAVNGSGAGPYLISLSGGIPPGGCTTLTFAGAGQPLRYESLPADINLDAIVNTADLLALVQALNNGSANLPANLARYDVNRSGAVNTQDLLKMVNLLNGIGTTQVWNGATLVPCQ